MRNIRICIYIILILKLKLSVNSFLYIYIRNAFSLRHNKNVAFDKIKYFYYCLLKKIKLFIV